MSFKIIGVGEVLWDLLPSGPQMGGAPANFAYHARSLGGSAEVISSIGNDTLGEAIKTRFEEMNLSTEWVQVEHDSPTGTVEVSLSGNGIPEYTIQEGVAWDHIRATQAALELARQADAICFGTLAQRSAISRQSIQKLVSATPASACRILDINLRQNFYTAEILEHSLKLANVLKLNDTELPVLTRTFGGTGNVHTQIEHLARRFDLRVVALTRGRDGSSLFRDGQWSDQPSVDIQVKDTVGAGDSFTAALCLGLLNKMDLNAINSVANKVASYVCGCVGATPALPKELKETFHRRGIASAAIKTTATLVP